MKENKKMNFFKRFYMSIFKLEDYPVLFEEKTSKSVGYLAKLILITVLILCFFMTMEISAMFEKGYAFFKTIPDFKYENGVITDDIYASGYDEEYNVFFVIDTSKNLKDVNEISELVLKEYGNNFLDSEISILAYKENICLNYYGSQLVLNYNDYLGEYGITEINKQELEKNIDTFGINNIRMAFYLYSIPAEYLTLFISFVLEAVMLALFASIVAYMVCRIDLKFKNGFKIASHAITLSIVITIIYNIVNFYTDFYMEYFSYMTVIIEYIYVVSIMFMIKSDKQKLEEELAKVEAVRGEVVKELTEEKEVPEDGENSKEDTVEKEIEPENEIIVENNEQTTDEIKDNNDEDNNDNKLKNDLPKEENKIQDENKDDDKNVKEEDKQV